LLRETELGPERRDAAPKGLANRFFAHVPTQFADAGTGTA
jgi:hypothetical protein